MSEYDLHTDWYQRCQELEDENKLLSMTVSELQKALAGKTDLEAELARTHEFNHEIRKYIMEVLPRDSELRDRVTRRFDKFAQSNYEPNRKNGYGLRPRSGS